MSKLCRTLLLSALLFAICLTAAYALDLESVRHSLNVLTSADVTDWRYIDQDVKNGQAVNLDDSAWKMGSPEFTWSDAKVAWIRKTITIPEKIGVYPVAGSEVILYIGVDDDGIIYLNGKRVQKFHWEDGQIVLTQNAHPGDKFLVAIKGINKQGPGRLLKAQIGIAGLETLKVRIDALLADLDAAEKMANDATGGEKARIESIADAAVSKLDVTAISSGNKKAFLQSLDAAEKVLEPLGADLRQYTCHLVGHAHIDMNWLWLWPETVDVCKNTFTSATNFMDQYPEFCFSQSQPSTYLATEENFPELFRKIQKYVKEGRWEITGGTWVEGDMNMASGESIVRQILYAKRYFKEKFGVEPRICWEPDTFGHAWTIPQILKKSDIDYYYFMRCDKKEPLFWWQSPDGSRVLAFHDTRYNGNVTEDMAKEAVDLDERYGVKDCMIVYGVGDHGGGPTRDHIDKAIRLKNRVIFPKVKFDTAQNYMATVLKQKQDFPVVNDELNFAFRGCYTTHADIKKWNRESENLLPTAEALSAIASVYGGSYPSADFVSAWRDTCFNQFHDIFDGTAIHGSYDYSRQLFESASGKGKKAESAALERIASEVDTRGEGVPVLVFNPLSWQRTDIVRMPSPFNGVTEAKVISSGGGEWPCQIDGDQVEFTAKNVPAMGYKMFWLAPGKAKTAGGVSVSGDTIENRFFRVSVDQQSGTVTSIYDKINNREVVPQGKSADLLQMLIEKPASGSAWIIGGISGASDLTEAEKVEVNETGPECGSIGIVHKYKKSTLTQSIMLYDEVPRIDVKLVADWREQGSKTTEGPMLKAAFPVNVKEGKATFEIPFGSIERPANGDEVPAQKWIDLSNGGYGVSLLNDCKYGHDVKENVLRITLLRSTHHPDPTPDQGVHEMIYSLYPHRGTWKDAGTVRRGYELNNPLTATVTSEHAGKLPKFRSFASVSPANLTVTSLKMAEDGDGFILRFYDSSGKPSVARVKTTLPVKSYIETNLIEREIGKKTMIENGTFTIPVGKYEIKTVKMMR